MGVRRIREPTRISLGDLEKVLEHLPEPNVVKVLLTDSIDYSSIDQQVQGLVPNTRLEPHGESVFRLMGATRESVLSIYRASDGQDRTKPKKIYLNRISWHWDVAADSGIELTPTGVEAWYKGEEPPYITQLRQDLSGTGVALEIKSS